MIFCLVCCRSQENLVERKHHRLARSARFGLCDRDVKPTSTARDQLHTIVSYPPTTTLTLEEQDLVWKFRFYLTSNKKALTKFLKCINWEIHAEVKQAIILLKQWTPMDVEDALELLSPAFTHPAVRGYVSIGAHFFSIKIEINRFNAFQLCDNSFEAGS